MKVINHITVVFIFFALHATVFSQTWNIMHREDIGYVSTIKILDNDRFVTTKYIEAGDQAGNSQIVLFEGLNQTNLVSEDTWKGQGSIIMNNSPYMDLEYSKGDIYFVTGDNGLYTFDGEQWTKKTVGDKFDEGSKYIGEYYREAKKVISGPDQVYTLASSYKVSKRDTIDSVPWIFHGETYSDLILQEENDPDLRLHIDQLDFGDFTDFVVDETGTFWFTTFGQGIVKYENDDYELIDIVDKIGLERAYFTAITTDEEHVYFISENTIGVSEETVFIRYNKNTKQVDVFDFPPIIINGEEHSKVLPIHWTKRVMY